MATKLKSGLLRSGKGCISHVLYVGLTLNLKHFGGVGKLQTAKDISFKKDPRHLSLLGCAKKNTKKY